MPPPSLVIRGGTIVDGTGSPPFQADVVIDGDRIAAIASAPAGTRELDATGLIVCPGFIDIHTHYDVQLCWDGLATPSPMHGVTTVVTGNCSLSMAPVKREKRSDVMGMFESVEDIPRSALTDGVSWTWETFGEFLDELRRQKLGVNVVPMVGHSTLRHHVMGPDAQTRHANPDELEQLRACFRECMQGGAWGISFSDLDIDGDGVPVASRWASPEERVALARDMAAFDRGIVQGVLNFLDRRALEQGIAHLGDLALASGKPALVSQVIHVRSAPQLWKWSLVAIEKEWQRGATVWGQATPRPLELHVSLAANSFLLYVCPTWAAIMRRPVDERLVAFKDARLRPLLVYEAQALNAFLQSMRITRSPSSKALEGRLLREVAKEQGKSLAEALIDISLADGLHADFTVEDEIQADPDVVAKLIAHKRVVIGQSDAGAHLTQFCGAGDTTWLLSTMVRERGAMTLERAVQRLTGDLADALGIKERGRLQPGHFADVVLFDAETVGLGDERRVGDVPGGNARIWRDARGVKAVVVNGKPVVVDGKDTGERPGRTL